MDATQDTFGLSQATAMDQANGECGMECPESPENLRGSECIECSKSIAEQDLENVNQYKENIITAADETCFDPSILAAFISRQTRGGSKLDGTSGWIPCNNNADQQCFGIMHIPECKLRRFSWFKSRKLGHLNFIQP